ncbi:MAG: PhoH family protein [Planctomycetota bacterium]
MIDSSSKTFVLDTNVLLHNPGALFAFADNHVVIPMMVLEELDNFKTTNNELGRNSREVARNLDRLRSRGSLRAGVETDSGGAIQVVLRFDELHDLLPGVNDNRILGCAHILKREGMQVRFISKDINARIKADALGIPADDFENQKVNFEELYTGWRRETVAADRIAALLRDGVLDAGAPGGEGEGENGYSCNQYVELLAEDDPERTAAIARFDARSGQLHLIPEEDPCPYGISARNVEQRMAIDALLADDIRLVSLVGSAGTGKTLLALAAGMARVLRDSTFHKLLVTRPIMPLGKDIGYLPGSKDDKMSHWMGPIFDNLFFLLGREESDPDEVIKHLIKDETVILEALTYIRGRSISEHYLIVDEAQNLTPHEVKTIISRAGEGTKIVLTGDPYQIDNPYLDANSNGLTYLVERMRGQELAAHITLLHSERSQLAGMAAEVL